MEEISVAIVPHENVCGICIQTSHENQGQLIRIPCQKTETNPGCHGTLMHETCFARWIPHQRHPLFCFNCHHARLIIHPRYFRRNSTFSYRDRQRFKKICLGIIFLFIIFLCWLLS